MQSGTNRNYSLAYYPVRGTVKVTDWHTVELSLCCLVSIFDVEFSRGKTCEWDADSSCSSKVFVLVFLKKFLIAMIIVSNYQ